MTAFYKRLKLLIDIHDKAIIPEYPLLKIYFGEGSQTAFAEVRNNTLPDDILLYLFPDNSGRGEDKLYKAFPKAGKTLFIGVSDRTYFCDRVSMAVTLLEHSSVEFSINTSLDAPDRARASAINAEIDKAQKNYLFAHRDKSLSLALVLSNAAAFCRKKSLGISTAHKRFPAVICGAGPSLHHELDTLKKYYQKIFIIATGHSFKTLMSNGITPDAVVEIDPVSRWNWIGHDYSADVPLVAAPNLSPTVVNRFKRIVWGRCSGLESTINAFLDQLGLAHGVNFILLKTVTISALDFALKCRFENITLIGNDLAIKADGTSHADAAIGQEMFGDEPLVELAANEGGQVFTTPHFKDLKDKIEEYLRGIDNAVIHNSTTGGAVIAGTVFMPLEEFCGRFCQRDKEDFFRELPRPAPEMLENLSNLLEEYVSISKSVINTSRAMISGLTGTSTSADKLKQYQKQLADALGRENIMRTKSLPLLEKVQSQTCDLLNEMPGVKECPNASPPVKHLENIILRYSIMQDLTSDFLDKVNKSIAQIKEACFDGDYLESLEPYKFSAFRRLAINFIRKNNSEYAKMLEEDTFGNITGQFSFFMQGFQRHPRITRLDEHGKAQLWTYTLDMGKDFVADKLRVFLMDNTYNLDDYAVIFLVPADWSGVVKFYQMYPRGEAMVFDPFPELFSEIINYCLITPQLPPEMVVAAWSPELRRREKICQRTVARWKREGRKVLIYTHPLAVADPEVISHRETLEKLIATA